MPEQDRNSSHVSDPKIIAMLREQMRTKDLEGRRKLIFDIQRSGSIARSSRPASGPRARSG